MNSIFSVELIGKKDAVTRLKQAGAETPQKLRESTAESVLFAAMQKPAERGAEMQMQGFQRASYLEGGMKKVQDATLATASTPEQEAMVLPATRGMLMALEAHLIINDVQGRELKSQLVAEEKAAKEAAKGRKR